MKRYNKNIKLISTIILTLFLFNGCEDYLMEEHPTQVTTDFLYNTKEGLEAAVVSLYAIERAHFPQNESAVIGVILADCGTDLEFNRALFRMWSHFDPRTNLPTRVSPRAWWQMWYRVIERSNSVIIFGEATDIEEKTKKAILREAYVYRAYAYFWLLRKFDNIWLNLEPTTYENIEGRVYTPAKQEDVYELIINDLETAISYYGNDWSIVPGRFNQGVARMLRADVALWLEDWPTAASHTSKIIEEGPFELESDVNKIFTRDRRNNTNESMYVMQFDEFAQGGGPSHRLPLLFTVAYRFVPGMKIVSEFGGYGWTRIYPNEYLLSLYDEKHDTRWDAWWQHYYTYNDPDFDFSNVSYNLGDTLKYGQNSQLSQSDWFSRAAPSTKKYWDWEKVPEKTSSSNNVYIFRYPVVLFIAAEAYMRMGESGKALEYINLIRKRSISAESPNQLLTEINQDILLEEHARELAFEGYRWFTLKRLGILIDRVRQYGGATHFRGIPLPEMYSSGRVNIQDYHIRWPIPQDQLDAMAGYPQNEGY